MEPGNKKSAFKLRSGNKPSIAKLAGLENIFGKLQDIGQKAKDFKEKRQSESRINIKQDMQDKQARTRRGESKFQEKTRMRKEFNKFKRRNKMIDKDKDGMSDLIQAPSKPPKGKETVSTNNSGKVNLNKKEGLGPRQNGKTDLKTKTKVKTSTAPKINWKTAPKVGTQARTKWYKKHKLKLDDTTPKLQSNKKTKTSKKSPSNPDNFSVKTPKVNKYKKDSPSNPDNFSTTPKNPRGFNYDFEKNFFEN